MSGFTREIRSILIEATPLTDLLKTNIALPSSFWEVVGVEQGDPNEFVGVQLRLYPGGQFVWWFDHRESVIRFAKQKGKVGSWKAEIKKALCSVAMVQVAGKRGVEYINVYDLPSGVSSLNPNGMLEVFSANKIHSGLFVAVWRKVIKAEKTHSQSNNLVIELRQGNWTVSSIK